MLAGSERSHKFKNITKFKSKCAHVRFSLSISDMQGMSRTYHVLKNLQAAIANCPAE